MATKEYFTLRAELANHLEDWKDMQEAMEEAAKKSELNRRELLLLLRAHKRAFTQKRLALERDCAYLEKEQQKQPPEDWRIKEVRNHIDKTQKELLQVCQEFAQVLEDHVIPKR